MKSVLLNILFLLTFTTFAFSQKIGLPKIINYYDPENIFSTEQIWDIQQKNDDKFYLAASSYFLEFDGVKFKNLFDKYSSNYYSFDFDPISHTFFIGSYPILSLGKFENNKYNIYPIDIPLKLQSAWKTYYIDSIAYFFINKTDILIFHNNQIQLLNRPHDFVIYRGFAVNKKIYCVSNKGIAVIENKNLKLIKTDNDSIFSHDVRFMIPYDKSDILLGTHDGKFYLLNTNSYKIRAFKTEIDNEIKNYDIYNATKLDDSTFIITTLINGIYLVNLKGQLIENFNETKGIASNAVYTAFVDSYKNIWLGTGKGLTLIAMNNPIRYIDARMGLNSTISTSYIFGNKILIGTYKGLFAYSTKNINIKDTTPQYTNQILYASRIIKTIDTNYCIILSYNKISIVDKDLNEVFKIDSKLSPRSIVKSPIFDNRYYFVNENGILSAFEYSNTNKKPILKEIHTFENLNMNFDYMYFDKNNDLWLAANNMILLIDFDKKEDLNNYNIYYYDTKNGLPNTRFTDIFEFHKTIYISSSAGTFYLSNATDSFDKFNFVKDSVFYNHALLSYENIKNKSYFVSSDGYFIIYDNNKFSYIFLNASFEPFFTQINHLKSTLAINSKDKVFLIDTNQITKLINSSFKISLSSFDIDSNSFQIISNDSIVKIENNNYFVNIPIERKSNLKFTFRSNFYENANHTHYQFYIVNESDTWEELTDNNLIIRKIKPGTYRVLVKAINYYHQESNIIEINFTTKKPWYLKPVWLIIIFLILFTWIFLLIRSYITRLKRQKSLLEDLVNERTAKLEEQKEELASQTNELKDQKKILERETRRLNTVLQEMKILSLVAQKTNNSVIIIDQNGKFEWWNRSFVELFGSKLEKYKHLPLREVHKNVRPDIFREIKNYTTDKGTIQYTNSEIFENGEQIWYQTSIIPIESENGLSFVVIDYNITNTKNYENQIQNLQQIIDQNKTRLIKTLAELKLKTNELTFINRKDQRNLLFGQILRRFNTNLIPITEFYDKFFFIDMPIKDLSGDFNGSIKINDNELVIFIGDSTGHRVKGAIISTICTSIIKETLFTNPDYNISETLSEINNRLYDVLLKYQDEFVNLALIKINRNDNTFTFGGSRIPLFYITCNHKEIINKIESSKYNLGEDIMANFEQYTIKYESGTRIYVTTDGWTNQFDKFGQKKYTVNRAKNFLMSIQNVAFERHSDLILNEIKLWQGNFEQIDDILIFGLEID